MDRGTGPTGKAGVEKAPSGEAASGVIEATPKKKRFRPFSSYSAALKYLDDRVNFERVRPHRVEPDAFRLDRMRALMSALGDPQDAYAVVHIAGSKGKGSACEMVASCMRACGSVVGLYTSPHLTDVRERAQINGEVIDETAFIKCLSHCRDAAREIEAQHGVPTYFELTTAMALTHFADQAVDLAVLEVGLGGRLDSTNIVTPAVCGITEIQLEHTELLGDTVEQIAAEKAGIMKPGVPCVSVPQSKAVLGVFAETAARTGAELLVLGKDIDYSSRFEASHGMKPHARVCVSSDRSAYEHLPVPLLGEHQATNCGLALAIVDQLRGKGFDAAERDVARGLSQTPRRGRMEIVFDEPTVMVDGAHTGESVKALVRGIGAHMRCDSMVVIFGCAADKNIDEMLEEIGRGADKIIFTKSTDNPRAMDPAELRRRFEDVTGKMAQVEPTVKDAINVAARAVGRDDLILVTGSFWLAGEARRLLEAKKAERVGAG
ncbi:MAG: folylpolyglutamate synthase/dihydrofolate synthase family protein [Planctomycetota bacterium]